MEQTGYTNNQKGLNQDSTETGETYSFALNATVEHYTEEQPYPYLSNTPSNLLCYKHKENEIVVGQLSIHEWNKTILAVYNTSTKKKSFIEISYIYNNKGVSDVIEEGCCDITIIERLPQEKIVQKPICNSKILLETDCFDWSEDYSVKFVYKITDCTLNIYFNNCKDEDRFLYFDYDSEFGLTLNNEFLLNTGTECSPVYTTIDCSKTKWYPDISYPCVTTSIVAGNKEKGVYSYLIAYSTSSGVPLTSFKSITQPFNITKDNQGIKLKIGNISKNTRYNYYVIAAVETVKGITSYHIKEVLSVEQTEWIDSGMGGSGLSLLELYSQYPFYEKSCSLAVSNNILFKAGLTEFDKFNLQPVVNLIELEWVSVVLKEGDYQIPEIAQNYRSLMRDEVYAFGFQPVSTNGEELPVFPIVGRKKINSDSTIVSIQQQACDTDNTERWQIYNTATREYKNSETPEKIYNKCSLGTVYESGSFGYYESTEVYPHVPEVWDSTEVGGENLCGQPIRHFQVPDHCVSVHQSSGSYSDPIYIFPIGVRLKDTVNIELLLDKAVEASLITQNQRDRISGYKIVRGNRAGNKSVIAKGLLYDVWKYSRTNEKSDLFSNSCTTNSRDYFYPNYPFNDLNEDKLIAANGDHYKGKNLPASPQSFTNSNKTRYTFHSPDTHFTQPSLGNYLKLEAEVSGKAIGYFNISEDHAKYKLLGDKHYNLAKIFAQWMASTVTSPTEEAMSGTAASVGKSIGSAIPGLSQLGGSLGGLIGGLIGTNIAKNSLSHLVFKNSIILSQTEKILDLFKQLGKYNQHHYQHQSIGKYNNIICYPTESNKVKLLDTKEYIQEGKLSIQEKTSTINFNNSYRESAVYLRTESALPNTAVKDNSRVLISEGTGSSTEDNPYLYTSGRPSRFKITATEGRFRLVGVLCNPVTLPNGGILDEEDMFQGLYGADAQGDFNSKGLRPDFNLNFITDCRYTRIYARDTNLAVGNESVDYGDLEIVVYEECSGSCTDVVDAKVTYPCKCNEPTSRDIASFYCSIKNKIDNQYGNIYDINWLDTSSCITPLTRNIGKVKNNLTSGMASAQYCITTCPISSVSTVEYQYCTDGVTVSQQRTKVVTTLLDCSVQVMYSSWTTVTNCDCFETTWTNTGTERCLTGTTEIQQVSNCGTYRYVDSGQACTIRTDYWNLLLCSDNSNATYQVEDSNLSAGVVIKGNNGVCYTVINQGALVGPLLNEIGYYETGNDCSSCATDTNCGVIQLQVTLECRNNGMEVTLYPYNSCTSDANNFTINVVNSSGNNIIINRTAHNKYVIQNNNPTPYTTHTDVTISGYGDSFTYDIWTNTCDHDNCPLDCPESFMGTIQLNSWDGNSVNATYVNSNLYSWQSINWYNDNTQTASGTFNFSGTKTGGSYVKLQAQPSQYNDGSCYCHGFNQLYLR